MKNPFLSDSENAIEREALLRYKNMTDQERPEHDAWKASPEQKEKRWAETEKFLGGVVLFIICLILFWGAMG